MSSPNPTAEEAVAMIAPYRAVHLRVAYRITLDNDLAEDAYQDAVLRMLQQLHRFDEKRDCELRTWFQQILINKALDIVRYVRMRATDQLNPMMTSRRNSPAKIAISRDTSQRIRDSILHMPPPYQETLLAFVDADELTMREHAEAMGVEVHTVKNRFYRGRYILYRRLLSNHVDVPSLIRRLSNYKQGLWYRSTPNARPTRCRA